MVGRERNQPSKPEVVGAGSERGSATYGGGFKGEHRVSFSARVFCFFCETVFVGRHDTRRAVCGSLADLFDVERNPATILSLLRRAWGTVSLLVSEHLFFFEPPSLGNSAACLCCQGCRVVPRLVSQHLVNLVSRHRRVGVAVSLQCCQCQSQLEWWRVWRLLLRMK